MQCVQQKNKKLISDKFEEHNNSTTTAAVQATTNRRSTLSKADSAARYKTKIIIINFINKGKFICYKKEKCLYLLTIRKKTSHFINNEKTNRIIN